MTVCTGSKKGIIDDIFHMLTVVRTIIYKGPKTPWENSQKKTVLADSRNKNYNPAACGTKTTFTERQTK